MFAQTIRNWAQKALRTTDVIYRESVIELGYTMTQPYPGLTLGAGYVAGVVPFYSGELIGSATVSVNGSIVGQGSASAARGPDFDSALSQLKSLDDVEIYFSDPKAPLIEYGFSVKGRSVPGRFFREMAIAEWPNIVGRNVNLYGDA